MRRTRALLVACATAAVALAVPVSASATAGGGGTFSFTQPTGSPFGIGIGGDAPVFVAQGDLDRDGTPDLVTANDGSNDISVLRGNGGGGFAAGARFSIGGGTQPAEVAIADFNRDGKPDVATVNRTSNNVSILLGNGLGSVALFGAPITVGASPNAIGVGDFNRDGKLDLVTVSPAANRVDILTGNGSGGFVDSSFSTGGAFEPFNVTVADVDRDGKSDLVLPDTPDNKVAIFLGNGPGTFTAATGSPIDTGGSSGPADVAVADYDRDGKPDLAVANEGSGSIGVWLGTLPGQFTQKVGSPYSSFPGQAPSSLTAADLDGDGTLDLLAVSTTGGSVATLAGDGAGAFAVDGLPIGGPGGNPPTGIAVGDLDGDGRPDVAAANHLADNVTVALNTTDFQPKNYLGPPTALSSAGDQPTDVETGDFNRDGKLDVAMTRVAGPHANTVGVRLGNGSGGFALEDFYPLGATGPAGVTAADLNGDGYLDLAVTNTASANVAILLNSGSGTFLVPAAHAPAVSNPLGITHGDFDRDGDQDLAVALSTGGNEVVIEVNNGTGTLTPGAPFGGFNGARDVAAGDADGDGILDLAVTNPTLSVVHGYQGVPASPGSFTTPPLTFPVGTSPWALTNGDLDRDGDLDLAVAIRGANAVTALLNDGSGSAGVAATFAAGAQPAGVATADLNGDGIPDVATANSGSNDVSVLRGTGSAVANSTFDVPSAFAAAGTAGENAIATGDFNNDGDPDVVTTDALYLSLRDPAAPSTTDDVPAAPVSGPRAVTLTAGDSGGSGLQTTYYEKSLSPPTPTTSSPVYDPNNKPVLFQGDTIKYFSTDRAGNREPVRTSSQLIVDAAAPPPPSGLATTPASPADDNAPRITGSAEAGSTVTIRSGACNGAVVATGTAAEFASPGLTVSVPDNTTTFFLATATDGVGNTSDCSAPVAYEEKTATPPPPPEPKKTANVEPKSGAVTVRCPGQGEATLAGDSQIQSGCRIDATDGVVTLTAAADAKGNTQSADFFDGAFKFKQVEETQTVKGKKVKVLITELTLDVAKPTGCTTKKAGIGTAKNGGHLWGRGKGRYRTRGRRGAGTVRGTEWLTEERCAGTFFQVKTGIVEVQDFTLKKTVLVKKGKTYLAPATKPAKKGKN